MNNLALYGKDLFNEPIEPPRRGILSDKFILPPFSVLNACEGFWQERKRAWLSLGIKSEIGRGCKAFAIGDKKTWDESISRCDADKRSNLNNAPPKPDCAINTGTTNMSAGTSIFDPVLCELIYKWFCPQGGQIVDCFAGGSVRGIVAALLGYKYWGCDLSDMQIKANREQAGNICNGLKPDWFCGDALKVTIITLLVIL